MITPEGLWMGRNWTLLPATTSADSSLATQRNRQHNLNTALQTLTGQREDHDAQCARAQTALEAAEATLKAAHQRMQQAQLSEQRARFDHQSAEDQYHALQKRQQEQASEREKLEKRLHTLDNEKRELDDQSAALTQQLHDHQASEENLKTTLKAERERHKHLAKEEREAQDILNATRLKRAQGQTREQSLQSAITRANQQLEDGRTHLEDLERQSAHARASLPDLENTLERLLERQHQIEKQSEEQSQQLDAQQNTTRTIEARASAAKVEEQKHHAQIDRLAQAMETLETQQRELLQQYPKLNIETVRENLDTQVSAAQRDKDITRLNQEIEDMGAVNLLAENQFNEARARHESLSQHCTDLEQARALLEQAIHKIDQESRKALQHTLDTVNANVQREFSRIFGGGQCTLKSESDDLLEGGLVLLAQPPGKKVSLLIALSGGEKALTAMALIFAIFDLNPAPFCLLDEVDAPLDDRNTARFATLVHEFSRRTQFVIVTHNRITMEAADTLIGITMAEPGTSRQVSVDLQKLAQVLEE